MGANAVDQGTTVAGGAELPIAMRSHDRLGFSLDEYSRRYELILSLMARAGVEVLLVRGPENITYLCGYETPGYYKYQCLIVTPGREPTLILRRFEEFNAPEYSWLTEYVPVDDWEHGPTVAARRLKEMGLADKRIGVEKAGHYYTVEEHETLGGELPDAALVDATWVVHEARMRKSAEEIAMMRRAAAVLDQAVQAGIEASVAGARDSDVNAVVNKVLMENGGEYMGLPPFVLSGARTCLPHQTARGEVIRDNDLVYFEVSASRYRYAVALMRTVFIGEPDPRWRACAEACIGALEAAMETIRPGVTCEEVDATGRAVVERAGFGKHFRHRFGYSIGVNYAPDWGEGEIISLRKGEGRPLEPGMTFHMVPLCLVYRDFGVGFSETIRVTETGCERFSSLPREIIVK